MSRLRNIWTKPPIKSGPPDEDIFAKHGPIEGGPKPFTLLVNGFTIKSPTPLVRKGNYYILPVGTYVFDKKGKQYHTDAQCWFWIDGSAMACGGRWVEF